MLERIEDASRWPLTITVLTIGFVLLVQTCEEDYNKCVNDLVQIYGKEQEQAELVCQKNR